MTERNPENLHPGWQGITDVTQYCGNNDQYLSLFDKHFKEFSGTILEIGPGTGYLCKHIINCYDVEYSILDRDMGIPDLKKNHLTKEQAESIEFI